MTSFRSDRSTSARLPSITDPQTSIDEMVLVAYFTTVESELAARRRSLAAHLREARETGSPTAVCVARSEYQAFREDFDHVFDLSKVEDVQAK